MGLSESIINLYGFKIKHFYSFWVYFIEVFKNSIIIKIEKW